MEPIDRKAMATRPACELAVGWLTMFVIGSDLFVVSPMLPLIAADYGSQPASAGLSVTLFSTAYLLSAPLFGCLADKIGRSRVLTYCLCAFGIANLLTAMAGNLGWLLAARSFAGASAAGVSPSVYALVAEAAPSDKRARWLAITVAGLLISLSLGAPLGALTGASLGWPIVFAGLGLLGLLLAWVNKRVWRTSPTKSNTTVQQHRPTAGAIVGRLAPTVLWSIAVYAMYTYLGEGLISFGYSTEEIAGTILFYGVGAIGGVLMGGRMADRLGTKLPIAIGLFGLYLCFLLLRFALDRGAFVTCAFGVMSFVAQLFFPAQQLRLANDFPTRRATILALNNMALFLGISLGSLIGGQAVSLGGFDLDLTVCAVVAIIGWTTEHVVGLGRATFLVTRPRQPCGTQGVS